MNDLANRSHMLDLLGDDWYTKSSLQCIEYHSVTGAFFRISTCQPVAVSQSAREKAAYAYLAFQATTAMRQAVRDGLQGEVELVMTRHRSDTGDLSFTVEVEGTREH